MSNELIIRNMEDVNHAAKAMAASGYFTDAKEMAQAAVKIMAGQEMGFGAFSSMSGIHIINGKPAIGSNLIAAAIKRHPMYNYRVVKHTDTECVIQFFERLNGKMELVGESTFTMQDAQAAGLTNNPTWRKFPRNMLFSRAISNGARWYCPDIFGGAPVYTPEELGAVVDEDENVIAAEFMETAQPAPRVIDAVNAAVGFEPEQPEQPKQKPTRPYAPKTLLAWLEKASTKCEPADNNMEDKMLDALFNMAGKNEDEFNALHSKIFSRPDLGDTYQAAVYHWLHPKNEADLKLVKDEINQLMA